MKQLLLIILTVLLLLVNIFVGSVPIPAADVLAVLTGGSADETVRFIVLESRLPQAITALLSGAALAVAGQMMQTIFANPLADPSLLGVNSGAALGVALSMLLFGGIFVAGEITLTGYLLTTVAAFLGALLVTFLLLLCNALLPGRLMLLVAGVMISFVASAVISLLSFWSTAQGVQSFMLWGLGNFSGVTLSRLPVFAALILMGLMISFVLAKPLNALLLGDDYAANVGVAVGRTRTIVLVLTGLLTAAVISLCGPISFVGLAVPHLARMWLRTSNHRLLLPANMLCGAALALLCNFISVLPGDRGTLPINTLTPLIGVPMVFYILLRGRGGK